MSMSEFIRHNMDTILSDWEQFAATCRPAAEDLSREELRDFGHGVLETVAEDMDTRTSSVEQGEEARTEHQGHLPEVKQSARIHAAERLHDGFTLVQLVEEYRALRASVTRRWAAQLADVGVDELHDLACFNEAIDQSMVEAVAWYSERLEEARDLFTGVLAHDLRNPLGAIIMLSEVLLGAEGLDSQHTKAAARIRTSGNRMAKMIGDLLDFTRARLGTGLHISPVPMDLARHCKAVVDELQAFHPDSVFALDFPGDLRGTWDPPRLEQLLSNLIGNAIAFGRPDAPITITARREDEDIVLSVHNEGKPIPADAQATIFDPLTRAAATEDRDRSPADGLGLGLFIANQIAKAHGGSISVNSSQKKGTTFTVTLPRQAKERRIPSAPI